MTDFPTDLIIAIDGPVAAGKTTAARLLAHRLGYCHIETGAMYRALAWKALNCGVDPGNPVALAHLLSETTLELRPSPGGVRVLVDGEDVTETLRTPRIHTAASLLSVHAGVRDQMVQKQRELGARGGVVMDGRDVGTVVFPQATVKFYVTASLEERGLRRFRESTRDLGSLEETLEEVASRDRRDMDRPISPLKPARDAIVIDTTGLTPEEVVTSMAEIIQRKLAASRDISLA